MINKKGKPISGGAGQFGFTPNVLNDAAQPSRTAQKMVKQPPAPFQNSGGVLGIPAPTNPTYRANANFAKDALRYGGVPKSVSVRNRPTVDLSAVGEPRLPKGYNPVTSGFPVSAQRVVGGGTQPSAKWGPKAPTAKQRKEYPGIFGRGR